MTTLRVESYEIPGAELGPENSLPMFRDPQEDRAVKLGPDVPSEDRRYIGWQTAFRVLPYRMQDSYTREEKRREFRAIVLENEVLRAMFLPELGGRMVSLLHKPTGRELLERNPVFQPANLALRNAWFSGGVEWNASHPGHHYRTCSPVFAARIKGGHGEPALRLYEWDRVKCFPYQIDLHLPSGSPFLFARVRIVNPHEREMPIYWWTNVAVPERSGSRTLVPASDTLLHDERETFKVVVLPEVWGKDISYSTNVPFSNSFFYRLKDGHRPWIADLDETGAGFIETSTNRLRGRKRFCWGMGQGGRRWQEYLSVPGRAYIELQAGLTRTQLECIPMPADTAWTWTHAFGLLQADPAKVHAKDWETAWRAAEDALEFALPRAQLDEIDRALAPLTVQPAEELLAQGAGWGALERRRIAVAGGADRVPPELLFDRSTLGPDQHPWLDLLEKGALPGRDPLDEPGHWMVQREWVDMLRVSMESGKSDHWLAWLHFGNMRMETLDPKGARTAWEISLAHARSAWALRNLAVIEQREGKKDAARDLLRQAWEMGPKIPALAIECARSMSEAGRFKELRDFIADLPEPIGANERIQILSARAAFELGDFAQAQALFLRELATIREGEVTLTDLWFALHERELSAAEGVPIDDALRRRVRKEFPPPQHIDFRMHKDV